MPTGRRWSTEEDESLRTLYPTAKKPDVLAALPRRQWRAIVFHAAKLKVKRQAREDIFPLTGSLLESLTEAERGYLAGIIDGEGTISFSRCMGNGKNRNSYRLLLSVSNTDQRLILWLHERFGGTRFESRTSGKSPRKRRLYGWTIITNKAIVMCREIAPYLVIKREQAEMMAGGFIHLPLDGRFALYSAMREHKLKGSQWRDRSAG
jgi:hypothetical protein